MVHHPYFIYQEGIVAHESTSLQNTCPFSVFRFAP